MNSDKIEELAVNAGKNLFIKLKEYVQDLKNKNDIDFRYTFENYLRFSSEKNKKIKTLLYRYTPKNLYDFYECVALKKGDTIVDTNNVNNVLDISHKVIIAGTGGIGKSIMMKHFFINCIETTGLIPILIELRSFNAIDAHDFNLIHQMKIALAEHGLNLEEKYFEYSLETGCYLILLDGFDEVRIGLADKVKKEINFISNKYQENCYIISARPSYEFMDWNDFTEMQVESLTKEQALSLINKLDYDCEIKQKFYKELDEKLYKEYKSFASNPLLLTIMFLTFESGASIPEKLNDFYEQAFTTLFHKHDATKGGYKREILSGLGYEDFKKVFSYVCFKSFFKNQYMFTEDKVLSYINIAKTKKVIDKEFESINFLKDLTQSVCVFVHEGLNYRFSHRSFQEYFAAVYTTQLDDITQKKLITGWMKEGGNRFGNNYLNMLSELQTARFIKNVLLPGLMEIKMEIAQSDNIQSWVFSKFCSGIHTVRSFDESNDKLLWRVNDIYLNDIVRYTCMIGGFKIEKKIEENAVIKKEETVELIHELERIFGQNKAREFIKFEDIKDAGMYEKVIAQSPIFLDWVNFCLEFLENQETSASKKRKVESILEDL